VPNYLSKENEDAYALDMNFSIKPDGCEMRLEKLFRFMFASANMNLTSSMNLIDVLLPLYRNIPESKCVINIFKNLIRGKKKDNY
jgi:hypothetical protein